MQARLGIWHGEVAVMVDELLPGNWALKLLIGSPIRRPSLIMKPSRSGRTFKRHDAQRLLELPWILRDRECSQVGFARCALTKIDLQPLGDGYGADLPYNHQLPWPEARECDGYRLADELATCIKLRKMSAKSLGGDLVTPPAHVIRVLTAQQRVELFSR